MEAYEVIGESDWVNANREAWLELRRESIGGSDAPSILGLSSYASPSSVQVDKWGLGEEQPDAEVMKWGRRMEPVIIQGLAEEIGVPIKSDGRLLRSRKHPFMTCTPDGLCDDGIWAQIKNTMLAADWADEVPKRVWVQVQHEMAVTDAPECIAAALLFGNRLVWQRVPRDDDFIQTQLIPVEQNFWEMTEAREPVPPDGSEATKRALLALFPHDTGEEITLDGSFVDAHDERLELKETIKTAKDRLAELDNRFKFAMEDATFAALPNGVLYSLKSQTRKEHFVKESTFRVLRSKNPKR